MASVARRVAAGGTGSCGGASSRGAAPLRPCAPPPHRVAPAASARAAAGGAEPAGWRAWPAVAVAADAGRGRTRSAWAARAPPVLRSSRQGRRTPSRASSATVLAMNSVPDGSKAASKADIVRATLDEGSDGNFPNGLRCAYQGAPGAYSEGAAMMAYDSADLVPCEQFEEAFDAVETWLVNRAVLPVENSLGGSIHRNYDLLLRHRLHIVGEVNFPVSHCLMALPGTKKEDLTRVLSHPQALAQCEDYLDKLGVVKEAASDTAGSAMKIAQEGLQNVGAIASARAADIYGLEVLDSDIQDDANNITRFIALARAPNPPKPSTSEVYKTSIVFALEEGPGVLFRALSCFALRDIDLTKIESRPMRSMPFVTDDSKPAVKERRFQYLFYLDFKASMADVNAQNALAHLEEMTTFLRVLGCYPMAVR